MAHDRRRDLGSKTSAALPAVWKALARKGWTHADLARQLKISTAAMTGILYGDHGAALKNVLRIAQLLGVKPLLWTKPCPSNWKPHAYEALRPKQRAKAPRESSPYPVLGSELGSTGTDD